MLRAPRRGAAARSYKCLPFDYLLEITGLPSMAMRFLNSFRLGPAAMTGVIPN